MENKRIAADVILGENVQLADFINLYGCKIDDGTKVVLSWKFKKMPLSVRTARSRATFICEE
jgi:hypothetical protein